MQTLIFDWLPKKKCTDKHKSRVNGYIYCGLSKGGAYCVFEPGNAGSAYRCPKGYQSPYPKR
jgi:hypothetical protein